MIRKIPKKFYKGALKQPEAHTVGELIALLQELPDDLPLRHGFGEGAVVTVFNIRNNPYVEFEEIEDR